MGDNWLAVRKLNERGEEVGLYLINGQSTPRDRQNGQTSIGTIGDYTSFVAPVSANALSTQGRSDLEDQFIEGKGHVYINKLDTEYQEKLRALVQQKGLEAATLDHAGNLTIPRGKTAVFTGNQLKTAMETHSAATHSVAAKPAKGRRPRAASAKPAAGQESHDQIIVIQGMRDARYNGSFKIKAYDKPPEGRYAAIGEGGKGFVSISDRQEHASDLQVTGADGKAGWMHRETTTLEEVNAHAKVAGVRTERDGSQAVNFATFTMQTSYSGEQTAVLASTGKTVSPEALRNDIAHERREHNAHATAREQSDRNVTGSALASAVTMPRQQAEHGKSVTAGDGYKPRQADIVAGTYNPNTHNLESGRVAVPPRGSSAYVLGGNARREPAPASAGTAVASAGGSPESAAVRNSKRLIAQVNRRVAARKLGTALTSLGGSIGEGAKTAAAVGSEVYDKIDGTLKAIAAAGMTSLAGGGSPAPSLGGAVASAEPGHGAAGHGAAGAGAPLSAAELARIDEFMKRAEGSLSKAEERSLGAFDKYAKNMEERNAELQRQLEALRERSANQEAMIDGLLRSHTGPVSGLDQFLSEHGSKTEAHPGGEQGYSGSPGQTPPGQPRPASQKIP